VIKNIQSLAAEENRAANLMFDWSRKEADDLQVSLSTLSLFLPLSPLYISTLSIYLSNKYDLVSDIL
jgi:hypothetical protein